MNIERVTFDAGGATLVGSLHWPESEPRAALVLTGPLTSVKEQAAGAYARAMAARGFVSLAFDHRTFGESGGEPRQFESPPLKMEDIRAESERAFLIATALRVAHTLGRKTVRWELDEDMDQRLSANRDASDKRADMQLCDLVLSKVDPDLVEVFVLYEIEGLTSPEIAELLQIPLGSVASRLRRAREQFRDAAARIEKSLQKEGNS